MMPAVDFCKLYLMTFLFSVSKITRLLNTASSVCIVSGVKPEKYLFKSSFILCFDTDPQSVQKKNDVLSVSD